jgi:hypothetical protein
MRGKISQYIHAFLGKLGRCTKCMRQSLVATLTMWAVFAVAMMAWRGVLVGYVIGAIAVGLTGLWALHIAVYAARAVAAARIGGRIFNSPARIANSVDGAARRQALQTLFRAAGAGVAASVPVLFSPSVAFAFCGQCTTDAHCGVGWVCRNTAPVNSGRVCNECVRA